MRRMTLILLFLSALLVAKVYAFEPQALRGHWDGEWRTSRLANTFSMTIEKIDGERVEGSFYIRGGASYHNKDIPFVGKLAGNAFSAETPTQPGSAPLQWGLTVEP